MKEEKIISGTDILQTDEKRTWRCTLKTKDNEIVTIPFEVLLKLIAEFDVSIEKYGNHYRATNFIWEE